MPMPTHDHGVVSQTTLAISSSGSKGGGAGPLTPVKTRKKRWPPRRTACFVSHQALQQGEERLMFCTAFMFCTAWIKSMEDCKKF